MKHIIRVDQLLYIEVYGDGYIIEVTADGRNLIAGQTMASLLLALPFLIYHEQGV